LSPLARITEPDVGRYLLRDEDEVVVDEVRRHWIVYVLPVVELWLAFVLMFIGTFVIEPADPGGWLVLVGLVLTVHAAWVTVRERRECFVVTNMRVFRLHGVLSTHRATMPLSRILDITVAKPLHGRVLGFGHFVFESAAQEQGLRDIRYVGRPDERDLSIQRVVQRSGLRGPRHWN
jgi:membrane protein YdbS with pleckstrin-like domain